MEKFEECNAQFIKHDFKKNDILIGYLKPFFFKTLKNEFFLLKWDCK